MILAQIAVSHARSFGSWLWPVVVGISSHSADTTIAKLHAVEDTVALKNGEKSVFGTSALYAISSVTTRVEASDAYCAIVVHSFIHFFLSFKNYWPVFQSIN